MQATHYHPHIHTATHQLDERFGYKPALNVDNHLGESPYLTPPHSALELASPKSNAAEAYAAQIAVSTAFYPGAVLNPQFAALPADLVIQAGDAVFFYVHSALIRAKSSNNLGGLLPLVATAPSPSNSAGDPVSTSFFIKTPSLTPDTSSNELTPPTSPLSSRTSPLPRSADLISAGGSLPTIIEITEPSPILNIVLHILYDASFARYSPDYDSLCQVFPALLKYGFSLDLVPSHSEFFNLLLNFAPQRPLALYALAAQYKLHDLAVAASQFTLGESLSALTDQQCVQMGPMYLKWLFFLHLGRSEALKRIVVKSLEMHPLGQGECTGEDQKALARAWGLVTAYILSMTGAQNISVGTLSSTYGSMLGSVRCGQCREVLEQQIRAITSGWMIVQSTI